MKKQVVIVGTGGQGVLFATRVIVEAAFVSGWPVISSETHGMAMRGGSVVSQVKIGKYLSPAIEQGQADVLLGLTTEEARSYNYYLKPRGIQVVNAKENGKGTIDAEGIARKMGHPRSGNMIFLGFAARQARLGLAFDKYLEAIEKLSPARFRDQNLAAFRAGWELETAGK
ncbi:MAG: 2-oxoacid:acceptor oxidoreductase family protein [Deltaproteobacteria bacterium]|nr:2-oxoacid:acceptor oxidoreductase family protein [Deltaproteobacteria bacterium]